MIIHQTSKDSLKGIELIYKKKMMTIHSECEYKLWTDDDLYKLCMEKYPRIESIWNSLLGIQKADLGRYVVLYYYGGLYVDTDMDFCRHISNALSVAPYNILFAPSISTLPQMDPTQIKKLTNFIIWVKHPKHPFIKELINASIIRIKTKYLSSYPSFIYVPNTTGSVMITEMFRKTKLFGTHVTMNDVCFDNRLILNIFSPYTSIPKDVVAIHVGGTVTNNRIGWNNSCLSIVSIEHELKNLLSIPGNSYQAPLCTIVLLILIVFTLYFLIRKIYR